VKRTLAGIGLVGLGLLMVGCGSTSTQTASTQTTAQALASSNAVWAANCDSQQQASYDYSVFLVHAGTAFALSSVNSEGLAAYEASVAAGAAQFANQLPVDSTLHWDLETIALDNTTNAPVATRVAALEQFDADDSAALTTAQENSGSCS